MRSKAPLVSLGLPVYNGENFLAEAIEAILAQSFTDFELIITDNASTDTTAAICEHYAAHDPRIRYYRNEHNLGAAPNFNLAFEFARGKYFKWVAHDDLLAPTFLARCVAVLEEDPTVVVAFSKVAVIDETGRQIDEYYTPLETEHPSASRRYRSLLIDWHMCFDIFGLIRTDLLRQTPLMGSYGHGDGVLLARLALWGRIHNVDEYLFYSRRHEEQSMRQFGYAIDEGGNDYHAYAEWFDPANKGKLTMPQWRILREYLRALWETPVDAATKLRCHLHIARWMIRNRRHLFGDLLIATQHGVRRVNQASGNRMARLLVPTAK